MSMIKAIKTATMKMGRISRAMEVDGFQMTITMTMTVKPTDPARVLQLVSAELYAALTARVEHHVHFMNVLPTEARQEKLDLALAMLAALEGA